MFVISLETQNLSFENVNIYVRGEARGLGNLTIPYIGGGNGLKFPYVFKELCAKAT